MNIEEIDKLPEPDDFHEEWRWLIARVKELESEVDILTQIILDKGSVDAIKHKL